MKDIIDVSRYQGTIDWEKVKAAGIGGAMLKTISTNRSYGGLYCDPTFERNYWGAKEAGLPTGAYFYTYATDVVTATAELGKLKDAITGKTFELPVAVDVEDNKLKKLSKKALAELVAYMAKTIEGWGLYAMIYTGLNFSHTELDMDALVNYDLWLAAYRSKRPSSPKHGMWQYTSKGRVDGITGNVDMSHAYKDYVSIIQKAGLTQARG